MEVREPFYGAGPAHSYVGSKSKHRLPGLQSPVFCPPSHSAGPTARVLLIGHRVRCQHFERSMEQTFLKAFITQCTYF